MQQNGSGNSYGAMTNDMLRPSGQQVQKVGTSFTKDAGRNVNNNVSVQTGEEFSFLKDHVSARNVTAAPDITQNYENRAGFDDAQNQHLGYEDLARILGLKRMESKHPDDVSDFVSAKGSTNEFKNGVYDSKISGNEKVNCDGAIGQRETNFGVAPGYGWNGLGAVASSVYAADSSCLNNFSGSDLSEGSQPGRIKFICSFGGKILPRPSDGKLRYVGGETRIISIRKNLSWEELVKKTSSVCKQPHIIKYQLPGEDLDALISVSSDEDLQNMIEEYQGSERPEGSQRLKIFLIPLGESENPNSFERSTIQQSNPDYEYVVAVNGMVDPSPRRTSGGQDPSFQEKSPAFTHPLEIKGDFSFSHHAQFLSDSQNMTRPCNLSPPFSPVQPLREESNSVHKQHDGDNAGQCSIESSSSFITAQLPPEKSSFDATEYNHFTQGAINLINCQHHGNQIQLHQPGQEIGVHTHYHNPIYDNASKFGQLSGEISNIIERPFHSENPPSHPEDPTLLLSAFTGPFDPSFGIPHAFSDSKLQEQGVHAACTLRERTGPYFPLNCAKSQASIFDSPVNKPLELCTISDFFNYHASDKLLDIESTESQRKPDLLYAPFSKSLESNEQISIGHKDGFSQVAKTLENEPPMRQGICEDSLCTSEFMNWSDEKKSYWHQNEALNGVKIPESVLDYSQHSSLSGTSMSDKENDNSCTRKSEASYLFPSVKQPSYKGNSMVDLQSKVPVVQFTHGSPIHAPLSRYKDTHLQEAVLSATHNQAGPSPKQNTCDLPDELQCPSKNVLFIEDVSLRDDMPNIYPDCKIEKSHFVASVDKLSNMGDHSSTLKKYNTEHDKQLNLVSANTEGTVSSTIPSAIQSESADALYTVDNPSYDILSPTATNAGSLIPDSVSEDVKGDDRDDVIISDALIAEMEASIYGLQIIRNADLEELQELGSGTYGTVYHGKWRGTDVAIKKIRKSCFAGRTSQQERLIKDFWREAQIISNLHHPNVVAFYGVVPDGTGETLATVTEYMVNGSLRHVLLKKDRFLDRRKKLMIAMDAAFGMEYLHSKNIVHFDLKCDNLLVNLRDPERPVCKVGDFGLSKIKRNTLVSGGVRGTLPWMAPELLNGSSIRVSEKVDIYSFGICMWEILTGEEPYADMHCGAIIGGIVKNTLRPAIPVKCDPGWRKLMEECWSADPASRPSFTEITKILRTMSVAIEMKAQHAKSRKMKSNVSS